MYLLVTCFTSISALHFRLKRYPHTVVIRTANHPGNERVATGVICAAISILLFFSLAIHLSFGGTMATQNGAITGSFSTIQLGKIVWQFPVQYERLRFIGSGSFGSVASAVDRNTGKTIAIKRLAHPFRTEMSAKRAYRELRLLRHMQKHENIIGLLHAYSPQNDAAQMQHIYFVTTFMDADLATVLRTQTLRDEQLQYLLYQLLRGLKYIHSAGVIHRDLKPANVAVNEECELRILDFGLARQTQDEMTGYVATRWYRAPEIMLTWQHYSQAASRFYAKSPNIATDIWSVGCILGEMIRGTPLFPATDHATHLDWILDLVGTPSEQFLQRIDNENAQEYIRQKPQKLSRDFRQVFPLGNVNALDLLQRMLEFDPDRRITAEQALAHRYLREYHDPQEEPVAVPFDDAFEGLQLSVDQWRERIFQEIQAFQSRQ